MPDLFSKPLNDVTTDDVHALIREEYPEGGSVEFKEHIPNKKGGQDSWYTGGKVEEYGRNQILEEVVAFANAHGGHILLGIKESKDKPHRAAGISPIPRCADLAEVLRLQVRDCIEPHIPIISTLGLPINSDGSGVVIIRAPESRMAPHRLIPNKECYFRHADRTESMTMRDIQDLTIQRVRGEERFDRVFSERQEKFHGWIREGVSKMTTSVGCRITLIPTTDIYAAEVYRKPELFPYLGTFTIDLGKDGIIKTHFRNAHDEYPILRGVRRVDDKTNPCVIQELHCSGLIEICYRDIKKVAEGNAEGNVGPAIIFQDWILDAVCNGFTNAESFSKAVESPDVEYAFEIETASNTDVFSVYYTGRYGNVQLGSLKSPILYPRMSFGGSEGMSKYVEIVINDIWNSCGSQFPHSVKAVRHEGR